MSVSPVVTRDALIRAYGVDCLVEEGKILFIGCSIDDWPVDDSTYFSSTDFHTRQNTTYDDTTMESDVSQSQTKKAVDLEKQPWKRPANWFRNRMVVKDFKRLDEQRCLTCFFHILSMPRSLNSSI